MSRKNTKGTILAIDMGNTNIVIGCVDDDKVIFEERLSTDLSKTELEYAISFKNVLEIYNIKSEDINGAIISSVVPQLVNVIKAAVEKVVDIEPLVVGPGVKTGLNILMDQPKQVGSDLIVDAKSIMGIFSLDLSKPIDLNIHADNDIDTILAVLKPYIVE